MKYPLIDNRDKGKLLEQIKEMAAFYVPEWNYALDDTDVGGALADLFAQMFTDTIYHANKLPYKYYLAFLNFIGLKMISAAPARGYITVTLNQGVEPGVYIKKGTQLYVDKGEEVGQVLYETLHDFYAVDNEITHIFCRDSVQNHIVKPYDSQLQGEQQKVRLFDNSTYQNLQKAVLFLGSSDLLQIRQGAQVEIEITNRLRMLQETDMAGVLADRQLFRWSFLSHAGWQEIPGVEQSGNKVLLSIGETVPLVLWQQQEGRWLKCEFTSSAPLPEVRVEELRMAATAEELEPDLLINNDLQLSNKSFLPFGENYAIYDDFYIGSEETFTKKGARITISFDLAFKQFLPLISMEEEGIKWKLIMGERSFQKEPPLEIIIENVIWEYWNGNGWARLIFDQNQQKLFSPEPGSGEGQDLQEKAKKASITFLCPEDTVPGFVSAHQNYWIRARVTKVKNAYKPNTVYLSPLIESIALSYRYGTVSRAPDSVILERDLALQALHFAAGKEKVLFSSEVEPEIGAYFCLQKPVQGGPVTLYFGVERKKEKISFPLTWQYLGNDQGRLKWMELKVSDETKMLSQSGLLTFIGKKNFARAVLFGETGCWLRALDRDRMYAGAGPGEVPEISCFYFNTARIQQQESMPEEYFSIEPHQPGKVCELLGEDLVSLEVWVEEQEGLTEQEQELLLEQQQHRLDFVRDETGQIEKIWIQWQQVEDLLLSGPWDRSFMADTYNGRVIFGCGEKGKIPPAGDGNTIRIIYKTAMGGDGNIGPAGIQSFADAVPYVNTVFNAEPVLGGSDRESVGQALQRGPGLLKNQNMAVTREDYLELVKQADKNIVRVKCLAHRDPRGAKVPGALTIAFLPVFYNSSFNYYDSIRENIWQKISKTAPCMVVNSEKIYIVEVSYLKISVDLKIVISDYNDYQDVMLQAEEKLRSFLDPVTGNYEGKGWEIGSYPSREKLYNVIKRLEKIRRVESVHLSANLISHDSSEAIELQQGRSYPLSVPACGEIELDITVEPDR